MSEYQLYCELCLKDENKLTQKQKDFLDGKITIQEYYQR